MCVIRMHYYAAMRAGKVKNNPFEVYRIPQADLIVVFLTEDELNALIGVFRSDKLDEGETDVLRFFSHVLHCDAYLRRSKSPNRA